MSSKSTPVDVYVSYRHHPDLKFNIDHYLTVHMPLVSKEWKDRGLNGWDVVKFLPDDPSGLHVQAVLHFDSLESANSAFANLSDELRDDLKNYSNYPPELTKAERLATSKY